MTEINHVEITIDGLDRAAIIDTLKFLADGIMPIIQEDSWSYGDGGGIGGKPWKWSMKVKENT